MGHPPNPQTWNRYPYVGNTPTNAVDPLGLDSLGGGVISVSTLGDTISGIDSVWTVQFAEYVNPADFTFCSEGTASAEVDGSSISAPFGADAYGGAADCGPGGGVRTHSLTARQDMGMMRGKPKDKPPANNQLNQLLNKLSQCPDRIAQRMVADLRQLEDSGKLTLSDPILD